MATGITLLRSARTALADGRLSFGLDPWHRLLRLTGAQSTALLLADVRVACKLEAPLDVCMLPAGDVLQRLEATALVEFAIEGKARSA